jgi:ADP-ribosyl-[dinitrogen reductase] hydrolase
MIDYTSALKVAIATARAAGALLRAEFHRVGGPRGQGGHAEVDTEAERLIRQQLLDAFPWDYLGEELGYTDNKGRPHLWIVDPHDGTSSYLKGRRGSSVAIAGLREGVPILGVVYAFAYPDDEGDLIAWAEGCGPVTHNGQAVAIDLGKIPFEGGERIPLVFVSQDADDNPEANTVCVAPGRYLALPSLAYRLARVAGGEGVAGISLAFPRSWDFAAGHALVRGAKGTILGTQGEQPLHSVHYAEKGRCELRTCLGGAPSAVAVLGERDWKQVFAKLTGGPPPRFGLARVPPGKAVADVGQLRRAQGCLLGQLAGDALGGLVEFQSLERIRARYPAGCRDLKDGGTWNNLAGQPTDDSEMALMLGRTLVRDAQYDAGAVLEGYTYWWQGYSWDHGGTLRQALGPACSGKTREERLHLAASHANPGRQSNGSMMRISPLGIFAAGADPAQGAEWARIDSGLTHPNPVCRDTCAVYVAGIAQAIATGCSAAECHAAALAEADRSRVEPSVRQALEAARVGPPPDYVTNMGWCLIALQNAFYQLLHAFSLEEGVIDTVMQGGDTDTTAAIAGALLGAVHGREAVPARWREALLSCRPLPGTPTSHPMPVDFWPVDALELAEALLVATS